MPALHPEHAEIRQAARRLLAGDGREALAPGPIADAAAAVLGALCVPVARLVGESGAAALLDRAMKECRDALGWDATGLPFPSTPAERVEHLRTCLRRLESASARDTAELVFVTFTEVLHRFLGRSLTRQLLHDLWPDVFPAIKERT